MSISLTVTATAGGAGATPGMVARVAVLRNPAASQTGATATQSAAAAHQVTFSTTAARSVTYGAAANGFGGANLTPLTGTTFFDDIQDSLNNAAYGTFTGGATGTPGSVTIGTNASFQGGCAVMEVLAAAGTFLYQDPSSPASVSTFSGTAVTSAHFSPPAGSLLVCMVSANGLFGQATTMAVTDSFGLTWHKAAEANATTMLYAGVFYAFVPALGTPYTIGHTATAANQATAVITAGATTAAGDAIVVGASTSNTDTVTGVTDSQANTYTQVTSNTSQYTSSMWAALNCKVLTNGVDTITVTYSAADTGAKNVAAMGCSGVANLTAVDAAPTPGSNAGSTSPSITSGVLNQAAEAVFVWEDNANAGGAITWSGSPGATIAGFQAGTNQFSSMTGWKTAATTSTAYHGTITSAKWDALLVSLTPVPVERQFMMIPAYIYPFGAGATAWSQIISAAPTTAAVIVNVNSGPGVGVDTNWQAAITQAQNAGITVCGYVFTSFGARSAGDAETDINSWASLYGVTNIFFDEVNGAPGFVSYYQTLVNFVHTATPASVVVLNPGVVPDQSFFTSVISSQDVIIVCEDTQASIPADAAAAPSWLFTYPASQKCVTVNGCVKTADMINDVLLAASAFDAQYVYVTDDILYGTLPSYFPTEVEYLAGLYSPSAPVAGEVVNQWSGHFSRTIVSTEPPLAPLDLALGSASSVGGGTGTPTTGNWLFAVAAWRQDAGVAGVLQYPSTVNVRDDVHNFWIPVSVAPPDTGIVRCAVWMAPAARAPAYVFASPTAYQAAVTLTVFEVTADVPWYQVAATATAFTNQGTSITQSETPATGLFSLGVIAYDLNTLTVTYTATGWAEQTQVTASNGSNHAGDLTMTPFTATSTGSAMTLAASAGSNADWAEVLITVHGVLDAIAFPYQPFFQLENWPALVTEMACGQILNGNWAFSTGISPWDAPGNAVLTASGQYTFGNSAGSMLLTSAQVNTFEGGTSGTTVSTGNSGGSSGWAADAVSIGASATLAYDNTHAAHGTLSCKVATGATSTTTLFEWTTSIGTQTTAWFRVYLFFTGNPSTGVRPVAFRSGGSLAAAIGISTAGKIQLINAANAAAVTFTNSIPLNQWFRVEGFVTGDPSAGVISATQYNSMDSTTPTETETATGQNTTGSLTQYWFGQQASAANVGPYWMDDIGISATGFLGPSSGLAANPGADSEEATGIVPFTTYTATAWVNVPAGWSGGVQAGIVWFTSGGGFVSSSFPAATPTTGSLQELTFSAIAPATAAKAQLVVQLVGTPPISTLMYVAYAAIAIPGAYGNIPDDQLQWTDLSSRTITQAPVRISRGIQYEQQSLETGQMEIALANNDGALTQGNTQSPYYPYGGDDDVPIRLRAIWPASVTPYSVLFSGFTDEVKPQLDDATLYGYVQVTAADLWSRLTAQMLSALQQEFLSDNPAGYYPCNDNAGATAASNLAPTSLPSLAVQASKNGTSGLTQAFGDSTITLTGDPGGTGWAVSGLTSTAGLKGWSLIIFPPNPAVLPPIAEGVTVEFWVAFGANVAGISWNGAIATCLSAKQRLWELFIGPPTGGNNGNLILSVYDKTTGAATTTVIDNSVLWSTTHFVSMRFTQTAWTVYEDGDVAASGSCNFASVYNGFSFNGLNVPYANLGGNGFNGTIQDIALYSELLPQSRIVSQNDIGTTAALDELDVERIPRVVGYGGFTPPLAMRCLTLSDLFSVNQAGPGPNVDPVTQITDTVGQVVSDYCTNVASSTLAAMFIDGPGALVYRRRQEWYDRVQGQWVLGELASLPLNANPDFRSGVSSWVALGAALTWVAGASLDDTGAAELTAAGTGPVTFTPENVTATPGQQYSCVFTVMCPAGYTAGATATLTWVDSGGSGISTGSSATVPLAAGGWTWLIVTGTAPTATAALSVSVATTSAPTAGTVFLVASAVTTLWPGEAPYLRDMRLSDDRAQMFNTAVLSQSGTGTKTTFIGSSFNFSPSSGIVVTEENEPSVTQRGAVPYTATVYLQNTLQSTVNVPADGTIEDLASWIVQTLGNPVLRAEQAMLTPGATWQSMITALQAEVGDTITFNRRPIGAPAMSLLTYLSRLEHEIDVRSGWNTTYQLSPAPVANVLETDSPQFGVLDGNNVLGW